MSISIKMYTLSDFSSDIIAQNIDFSEKKKFWTNNVFITKHAKHHKALLRFTIINKHKASQKLGQFFEFVQSIVDIGNLFQCFILFCSEESNLIVGRLVHTVLLDCDTHPPHNVCCYFIYSITDVELLIHSWFFARFCVIYRYEFKVFSIVKNSIPDCWFCFSFFVTYIDLLRLFKLSQIIYF